ncbi:MAG: CHASE2 domain-containing protein [Candidatus Magnetoovum sp. WYHC-5]|nr:CHASE2 domain-containing protein [Candidatus Magnetoovum sp. WYHC-5]
MGGIAIFLGFFDFFRNFELFTLDLRYRYRPAIAVSEDLGFIEYDDKSIELFGEWPWSRLHQVILVDTLNFYNARAIGYDVYFIDKQNPIFIPEKFHLLLEDELNGAINEDIIKTAIDGSFRDYDEEFAVSMKKADNVYIAFFTDTNQDKELIEKDITFIKNQTKANKATFNVAKRLSIEDASKTFLPMKPSLIPYLYKSTNIVPPLSIFLENAKGTGFAQPGFDNDSIVRNYILLRYFDDKLMYSITLSMLSQLLDFSLNDIEIQPDKFMIIKNALAYNTKVRQHASLKRQDIYIPIDNKSQTLLNWAGLFRNTYFHMPYLLISRYYVYNNAKDYLRHTDRIDNFLAINKALHAHINEDSSLAKAHELDIISRELTTAYIIQTLIEKGASKDEIHNVLKDYTTTGLFERVYLIVDYSLKMVAEISKDNNMTFEAFLKKYPIKENDTQVKTHVLEAFKNITWFIKHNRLKEAWPFYFPPSWQILANGRWVSFSPVELEQKILMVGLTGTNTIDLNPTPFEEDAPMVSYHLNILNSVLTNNFLYRATETYKYVATVGFSIVIGVVGAVFSIPISLAVTFLLLGGYVYGSYKIWVINGLWIHLVVPLCGMILTYIGAIVLNYRQALADKRQIRNIFAKMVSPDVLKIMEENPDKFTLVGDRKAATTYFSMLNGIEELIKTVSADELTALLSVYLTPSSEIIMGYGGYIDKYEGHTIMADFGVPLDDEHSAWKCAFSAIEQKLDAEAFNYYALARFGITLRVSRGFNYGYVSAGNMGSEKKFQYTVMGDPVNVAARFMAANYIYESSNALTGQDTYAEIKDYVYLRFLDRILLKGKTHPTDIYDVLGWMPDAYLMNRGKLPVPDYIDSLWLNCPPAKVFGYYYLWSHQHKLYGHQMAKQIRDFFYSTLDLSSSLFSNEIKKEIILLIDSVETIAASFKYLFNRDIGIKTPSKETHFKEIINNRIAIMKAIMEYIQAERIKGVKKQHVEAIYREGSVLLNKLEMTKYRLSRIVVDDEQIERVIEGVREFVPRLNAASINKLDVSIAEGQRRFRSLTMTFIKGIKSQKEQYHEMMSLAGMPEDRELKAKELHEAGLKLYFQKRWNEAIEYFKQESNYTANKGPALSFIERIENYKQTPPPAKWQGECIQIKK